MVYSGGRYVNYRYNAEGSLAELDYGEGDAAPTATYRFEYDSLGRLIRSQQRDGNTVTQRTEQLYDTANRLSAQGWTLGGTSYRESYAYDASDGSLTTLNTAVGTKIGYNYDALKRLRSRAIYQGSTPLFENRYAYATQSGNQSTALVDFFNYRLASDDGSGDIIVGYQYEYDNGGNITDIKAEVDGALIPLEHYEYEEKQGQLKTAIRYENGEEVDRWTYSYDTAGNILSEDHEGTVSELHEYAYEDGRWGDLLTSVDGIDLEYDGSGNPTLYANGTELLWNSSNGHFGEWKARELKELARNSFGVEDCDGAYSTLILLMLDQIQSLSGKADALEKEISRLFQSFDTTVTTIPGVGPIIGAVILSEVGDISRFSSADKLAAYIGVDPSVNQSGEFQAVHAHMSKRGSPYLRRCIWMASQVAVQRDPMFRAYYEKKAAEWLKYMTIIGHVTRKMTAVVFAILRDHKVYEPVLPTAA